MKVWIPFIHNAIKAVNGRYAKINTSAFVDLGILRNIESSFLLKGTDSPRRRRRLTCIARPWGEFRRAIAGIVDLAAVSTGSVAVLTAVTYSYSLSPTLCCNPTLVSVHPTAPTTAVIIFVLLLPLLRSC